MEKVDQQEEFPWGWPAGGPFERPRAAVGTPNAHSGVGMLVIVRVLFPEQALKEVT